MTEALIAFVSFLALGAFAVWLIYEQEKGNRVMRRPSPLEEHMRRLNKALAEFAAAFGPAAQEAAKRANKAMIEFGKVFVGKEPR